MKILSSWASLPALKFKMKKELNDLSAKAHRLSQIRRTPTNDPLHRKIKTNELRRIMSDLTMQKNNID